MDEECTIQFSAYQNSYLDVDLALYKATEQDLSSSYKVYILFMHTPTSVHLVGDRTISSACSGWQVFHLDHYVRDLLEVEETLTFRIIVRKYGKSLSCNQISQLFVMNASLSDWSPPPSAEGLAGFGGFVPGPDPEEEEGSGTDDSKATEGSFSEETNPFSIPKDELIGYIPILTLFYAPEPSRGFFEFQRRKRGAIS